MDSQIETILIFWGSFLLLGAIAFTGLIDSFLPTVPKSKRIKRIAIIFGCIVILIIIGLFILSKT